MDSQGGASVLASRVPQEHLKIARHFNAGFLRQSRQVPEGRPARQHFSRPFGTDSISNLFPALKRRAIFGKSLRDSVRFAVVLFLFWAGCATAETTNALSDAEIQGRALAQKILEQQPVESSTNLGVLKFKNAKGKPCVVAVRFITKVRPTNWVSVFQGIQSDVEAADKLAIIHETSQTNRYAVVHVCGPGTTFSQLDAWGMQPFSEENEKLVPFCQSDFWAMDLGLEFFHWPQQKILPHTTNLKRGREYTLLESTNPNPSTNGYSRVLSWIDKESGGILEAEAYDIHGKLLKDFAPKSFKKVNGQWQLQEMEIRNVQTGSRTRLEFDLKK